MKIVNSILKCFWRYVKYTDDKRLAAQKVPSGLHSVINIPYTAQYNKLNMLDVYYPEGTQNEKLPVIIDVHGGGWFYGDKELNKNYCLTLAKRGYIVFNISYRLCPEVNMAEQLCDVMKALGWIKQHIKNYPADENKILLTGDSAGGQLALFAACLCQNPVLREKFGSINPNLVPNCIGLTSPVAYLYPEKGIMGLNAKAVLGDGYKCEPWSEYLGADAVLDGTVLPPAFIVTSSGDGVGKAPSLKLYDDIILSGNFAQLMNWEAYEGKHLPHVFSVIEPYSEPANKTIDEMLDFFKKACENV